MSHSCALMYEKYLGEFRFSFCGSSCGTTGRETMLVLLSKNVSVQLTKVEAVKASRQAALALYEFARVHVVICVNKESCRPSCSAF